MQTASWPCLPRHVRRSRSGPTLGRRPLGLSAQPPQLPKAKGHRPSQGGWRYATTALVEAAQLHLRLPALGRKKAGQGCARWEPKGAENSKASLQHPDAPKVTDALNRRVAGAIPCQPGPVILAVKDSWSGAAQPEPAAGIRSLGPALAMQADLHLRLGVGLQERQGRNGSILKLRRACTVGLYQKEMKSEQAHRD